MASTYGKVDLALVDRFLRLDARLSADIQMLNEYVPAVLEKLQKIFEQEKAIVAQQQSTVWIEEVEKLRKQLQDIHKPNLFERLGREVE
jgi:uncharacterized membrane protein YgaE (UPF0421/DUF939 family)